MKKMNKILLMIMTIGVLSVSCKKDPEGMVAHSDGKSNPDIQNFQKGMTDEMAALAETEGMKTMTNFMGTFSSLTSKSISVKSIRMKMLSAYLDKNLLSKYPALQRNKEVKNKVFDMVNGINNFIEKNGKSKGSRSESLNEDFINAQGVYRYNTSSKEYDKVSSNYDGILLQFPADIENDPSNYNGELAISRFKVEKVTFDGEEMELPTNFTMNLNVNFVRIAGLSFDVVYGNDYIPVRSLNLNIFVTPLDFNLGFNFDPSLLSVVSNLTNTQTSTQLFSTDVKVVMKDKIPTNAFGYLQLFTLKADFQINIPEGDDPTANINESNFEDYIKLEVYSYPNNDYVGKLKMKDDKLVLVTTTGDLDLETFFSDLFGIEGKERS